VARVSVEVTALTPGDLGLLVLRLVVGLTFAAHGAQKAFGWWKGPGWAGWYAVVTRMGFRPVALWGIVSIGAELVGGLLLAAGLFTPFAAMALIGQSVVIVLKAHWARGFWGRDGGFEFPLSLAAGVVAIVGTGTWVGVARCGAGAVLLGGAARTAHRGGGPRRPRHDRDFARSASREPYRSATLKGSGPQDTRRGPKTHPPSRQGDRH
jgi:putative oxidoreductase